MFGFFRNQLKSVIECEFRSPDTVLEQFVNNAGEIQNASKLIVSPGQGAVLIYQGAIQGIIDTPGIYDLKTDNHPFITSLSNFRRYGKNENLLKIYFYKTTRLADIPWGTATPIKYQDKVYDIPVELGMSGNLSVQINDIELIFKDILGVNSVLTIAELKKIALTKLITILGAYLANKQISLMEIDANFHIISQEIFPALNEFLLQNGMILVDFNISGTNLDNNTKERINKIADAKTVQQTNEVFGISYMENEKLGALRDLARNEGANSAALQLGAGLEIGKQLINTMQENPQLNETEGKGNIEVISDVDKITEKLLALKKLLDAGVIDENEFNETKKDLLGKL